MDREGEVCNRKTNKQRWWTGMGVGTGGGEGETDERHIYMFKDRLALYLHV